MATHINLILLPYCQVCSHLSKQPSSSTLETWWQTGKPLHLFPNPCCCNVFAASAAEGCFAHMCWNISLLHWWNLKVEIISYFSRANCWQMGLLSLLPSRGMPAGKDFLPPDLFSVHPHPQVLVWWRVGWILALFTVISCVLGTKFQRVVTGE